MPPTVLSRQVPRGYRRKALAARSGFARVVNFFMKYGCEAIYYDVTEQAARPE